MHLSDSQPATSLYRDIAKTLISRIRDGHYAVGSALPREVDLRARARTTESEEKNRG